MTGTAHDRTKFIGGSDIAAVLGISPHRTPLDLWLDKTAPRAEESKPATRRGSRLEPYIRDMIKSEFGIAIIASNERYVDPDVPYFSAEIDAEILCRHEVTENIEIKTVHPMKAKEWGDLDTDELPVHYVAQAQWGLGVTGRSVCRVFALIGDDLRPYVVQRDQETIAALRERATEFWERYVLPKLRPPLDYANARVLDTLRRLYPGTDGTTRDASEEDVHWRHVMEQANDRREHYERVVDGAKAHLMERTGNAAFLKFNDGKAFRRKLTARKGFTVEPTSYMDFRLINLKDKE